MAVLAADGGCRRQLFVCAAPLFSLHRAKYWRDQALAHHGLTFIEIFSVFINAGFKKAGWKWLLGNRQRPARSRTTPLTLTSFVFLQLGAIKGLRVSFLRRGGSLPGRPISS